jgi:hypothetical protein
MRNAVEQGTNAAVIKTAVVASNGKSVSYTTEDPHTFKVGQAVTILGITGNTAANLAAAPIANVNGAKSFIAYVPNGGTIATSSAVVGTGASAVTAWVTNGWANQVKLLYGSPS